MINRHFLIDIVVCIYLSTLPSLQPGMLPAQVPSKDWCPMLEHSFFPRPE